MSGSLLVIDDDSSVLRTLSRFFERQGWRVRAAADGRTGVELYERAPADLVITDLEMPGLGGLHVIDVLRARDPDAMVLVLTAHEDVGMAVEALRLGAENFLTKPVDFAHLELVVARALEKAELRRHARRAAPETAHRAPAAEEERLDGSPAMRRVGDQLALYAAGAAHVLVTGETGTGKGWIARRLHDASPRAAGPFVEVSCAELPAAHLGAELFGQERGARGAGGRAPARGLLDAARGGTLFLDEIAALVPELQPMLLGLLERGRFRRLGGAREIECDARVVVATHADLRAAVRAGAFREDLYYRLAVLTLELPPLRERGAGEVARLAQRGADDARRRAGARPIPVTDAALRALAAHAWPGNVRELRNVMERAAALARGADAVDVGHLPAELRGEPRDASGASSGGASSGGAAAGPLGGDLSLRAAERAHVLRVLAHCGGNKVHAARALGITRATLYVWLQRWAEEDAARHPVVPSERSERRTSGGLDRTGGPSLALRTTG